MRNTLPSGGEAGKPLSDLAGVRVLVVEDQWLVADSLKSFLEVQGMAVSGPAATTADARRLAAAQRPDLAVVDINLKGELSYALIDEFRDQGIAVVVLSGYAVIPGLLDKVVAVLQKPFSAPELLSAFRLALAYGEGG